MQRRWDHVKDPNIKALLLQSTLEITPPEFRDEFTNE
jgi:hypothetical protein